MTIEFYKISQCHKVTKPWGHEIWLQEGNVVYPFSLKQLFLKSGQRTSLQVHRYKSESIIILNGTGKLLTWNDTFDCNQYLNGEYDKSQIDHIINNLQIINLEKNDVFHTPPGTIHRMIAETDLLYIEASTCELDDVIRLQDDRNRIHGRIDEEHK